MPVARYFFFVGGVLLALLFAFDTGSSQLPLAQATGTAAETTTQRIRSDQKWPERVVFDTSLPTIVPPISVEAGVPAPPAAAEISAKARIRETFAQFRPADEKKPEAKAVTPKRKVAKYHPARPMVLAQQPQVMATQQPRFGFFDATW